MLLNRNVRPLRVLSRLRPNLATMFRFSLWKKHGGARPFARSASLVYLIVPFSIARPLPFCTRALSLSDPPVSRSRPLFTKTLLVPLIVLWTLLIMLSTLRRTSISVPTSLRCLLWATCLFPLLVASSHDLTPLPSVLSVPRRLRLSRLPTRAMLALRIAPSPLHIRSTCVVLVLGNTATMLPVWVNACMVLLISGPRFLGTCCRLALSWTCWLTYLIRCPTELRSPSCRLSRQCLLH